MTTVGGALNQNGEQLLRIIFDEPTPLHRVQLHFEENELERTQEFTIRWSPAQGGPTQEVVRQQWTSRRLDARSGTLRRESGGCCRAGIVYQTGFERGVRTSNFIEVAGRVIAEFCIPRFVMNYYRWPPLWLHAGTSAVSASYGQVT